MLISFYLGQISASLGALKKASDELMQLAKREITEEKREMAYQYVFHYIVAIHCITNY